MSHPVAPLVSAVIPVRNGEAFIGEAIESVLGQSYERLECIVVDDGSSDGTAHVVGSFGDAVQCMQVSHRGVAAARNAGVRAARGEVIAFLDADDAWEPAKTERQVELLARRPDLGLVYCGLREVDANGRELRVSPPPEPAAVLSNTLLGEPPFVALAQTGLVPRHVLSAIGGFDEALSVSADSDLVLRLAARFPVAAVPEPLTRYRWHPDQMHRDIPAYERDSLIMLNKMLRSADCPPALMTLRRAALTNRALMLAWEYRETDRRQSIVQLAHAFSLSPTRALRFFAPSIKRRLHRKAEPARPPSGGR